jgi:hypothetical protein
MSTTVKIISWLCRIIVAGILLQTLFFKFSGAEESKYIFTKLMGAEYEAVGRIGSGIFELISAILILFPGTVAIGAVISLGVISGAILSHLTELGIVVQDDGGTLFILAVTIFVLSLVTLIIHRKELPIVGSKL